MAIYKKSVLNTTLGILIICQILCYQIYCQITMQKSIKNASTILVTKISECTSSFSNSFIEDYIKQIHKERKRKPLPLSPTSIMKINNLSIFLKGKPMNSSSYSSPHSL
uniref:Uncharacterized protein n=1 Tax=Micrurus surinamensis TaxID=129470 RepID=A0A2D4PSC6_MICSU